MEVAEPDTETTIDLALETSSRGTGNRRWSRDERENRDGREQDERDDVERATWHIGSVEAEFQSAPQARCTCPMFDFNRSHWNFADYIHPAAARSSRGGHP